MGATEEILSPIRRSNTLPRAIQEGTTDLKRREATQMSLLPAKCCGGLTALKTNTLTARGTAEGRLSTRTGPETGTEGPVFHHKKTLTTTVPFTAPTHTRTPARPQTHHTSLVMTGQSTSAPLGRNTITTAGQRCPSGRSPRSGWRENKDKRKQQRRQLSIVFPKTETTDERLCRQQQSPASEPSRLRGRSPQQQPSLSLHLRSQGA